jgi:hypothetical protein
MIVVCGRGRFTKLQGNGRAGETQAGGLPCVWELQLVSRSCVDVWFLYELQFG